MKQLALVGLDDADVDLLVRLRQRDDLKLEAVYHPDPEALVMRLAGLARLPSELGWQLLPSDTAVQALVIGSNEAALAVMESLRMQGLWVPAIRPPTVPTGTARLRIALSAAHTAEDVDQLLQALHRHAAECTATAQA